MKKVAGFPGSSDIIPIDMGEAETISQTETEEFERLCESCGYNLRGLTENRCPECGREFDPIRLPRARIPWLRRKEIGLVAAYFQTVWKVLVHPRQFAGEFRRPNLIPLVAGEKFRMLNISIAVMSAIAAPLAMSIGVIVSSLRRDWIVESFVLALTLLGIGTFVCVFFRIAIIPPASADFNFTASGMAVILDYASAPLAFSPVWTLSLGALFAVRSSQIERLVGVICVLVGCGIVGFVWITQIVLVSLMGRFEWSRVAFFSMRLIVHWAFAAFVAIIVTYFAVVAAGLTCAAAYSILMRKF